MTTPSGRSGRAAAVLGDDYQHLHAWSEAVDAARPGSNVTAFKIEAIDAGSYDDIVVLRSSGSDTYVQAKFAVDTADGFSVDWLLAPTGTGKSPKSLAQRALDTYRTLSARRSAPQLRLVTNRELASSDTWLSQFRSPTTYTIAHAARRLGNGETRDARATEALGVIQEHLGCKWDELMDLLDAWELRWAADVPNELRVVRARMDALGLRHDDDAMRAGRTLMRDLVTDGVRECTAPELVAAINGLDLRQRSPARVLSVSLIDQEEHAADADVAVDLRGVFAGRTGDAARGLPEETWAGEIAPALDAAVERLGGAGPVLVRAAARLPVWFYLGTRMRQVRDWTLTTELGGQVWSSADTPAPGVHIDSKVDPSDTGDRDLLVAISITADIHEDVLAHQEGGQLPTGDVLWLAVPKPGHKAVDSPATAAAIVDESRRAITDTFRSGKYDRLHLVLSAPRFVPLFLGWRWHRMPPAVVYEELAPAGGYQPAFRISG